MWQVGGRGSVELGDTDRTGLLKDVEGEDNLLLDNRKKAVTGTKRHFH